MNIMKGYFTYLGTELFQLVKEGLSIDQHTDKRIKDRLESVAQLCWSMDTDALLNKTVPAKIEQMISALQNAVFIKVDAGNETLKRLNETYQNAVQARREQEIINRDRMIQLEAE